MTKKHPVKEEEEEEGIKKEGEENQPQNPAGTVLTADPMKEEPESPLKQEQPGQTMPPRTSLEEVSTTYSPIVDGCHSVCKGFDGMFTR